MFVLEFLIEKLTWIIMFLIMCVNQNNNIIVDDKCMCKFCGKVFTTSTNMYRHMNHTCKIKKSEDKNRDEIYERLVMLEKKNRDFEKENKQLKKEVVSLKKNVQTVSNVTNNINNTKNINNGIVAHINLIGYGKEDLINKIYDDKKNYIEENQDEFIESLSVSRKKRWSDG